MEAATAEFDISVGFLAPPTAPAGFPGLEGGLRIEAGGTVLTAVANSEVYDDEPRYDARGNEYDPPAYEFPGRWLPAILESLDEALRPHLAGCADRYGESAAELYADPGHTTVVLSHLDGDLVRIATKPSRNASTREFPVDVMIGVAVDPDAVARALIDAHRECVQYVDRAYGDDEALRGAVADFEETYEDRIAALEDLLS